jgi:Protein of unknown function (DUF3606)
MCYRGRMIRLATVASVMASQPSVAPRPVVDTTNDAQTDYWAYRLNVSREQLFAAIDKVGPSTAAIRRHLGK